MRRSPSRRQKQAVRVENIQNEEATAQYFQISINVLEARKLAWSNSHSASSYVVVVLGKKKHRTSTRRNMDEPYYREYFIFEMYASIRDVQRSSIWMAVMEPRCCASARLLGETNIDLGAIWVQPHHQIFHKWVQLSLPRNPAAGPVGFLKVDVSIIFKGDILHVTPAIVNEETVESNLLVPSGSEQQRANYIVVVYGAFSLPTGTHCHGDRRFGKLPSTFVRVSFCGLVVKTAVQHRNNNPMYNEQVSIVEMFPNMSQMIRLDVCSIDGCFNRVLASTHLNFGLISHDRDNGFLPTFGPSLLHMYGSSCAGTLVSTGEDGPYHRGALLVSLKTVVPFYQQGVRTTNIEPVTPIKPENLWSVEDFCIYCPILEASMLDRRIAGKFCGVAITMGDINTDNRSDEEFAAMMNEIKLRKLHYTGPLEVTKTRPAYGYLDFPNAFPVLQLATRLPDFRFRMYTNNMIYRIVADLELILEDIERRLKNYEYTTPNELLDDLNKAIDDTSRNILKFLDIIRYSSSNNNSDDMVPQCITELDQKQLRLQKEEIENIYQQITKKAKRNSILNINQSASKCTNESLPGSRKNVKILLAETKSLASSLKELIYKTPEGWPDIVIWILNGGSRVAYTKISPANIIYSVIPEQNGRNCGRIQTVFMKPLKCPKHLNTLASGCYCIAGKIELILWMGLYRQNSALGTYFPHGYKIKTRNYEMCLKSNFLMIECRVFIYRAKFTSSTEATNLGYTFVRINAMNTVKESTIKQKTLTPVWNQVLKIHRMIFTTQDRLVTNPPLVLVEVYESDMTMKAELIGRFSVTPVLDDRQSYEYAPKLQWHALHKGVESTGQLLMSVQLLQVPERLMKTTVYSPIEESSYESDTKDLKMDDEEVETLPANLIPQSTTYKIDVYWWGLRDVIITRKPCVVLEIDELIIKSDIIIDKRSNCNFPNGRTSQIFGAPLNEAYCPSLNIRLYDSSTFGRTLSLGTNIVKKPNKYIVNWIAKTERDTSIRTASIMSSNFFHATNTLFKMNCNPSESAEMWSSSTPRNDLKSVVKTSLWRKLFTRKEPDEEEYVLLPMFQKEKDQISVVKKVPKCADQKDWWQRYLNSQNIYTSELELQPEFSKFRDWCATLKFYNGTKSGIPEKDEQLYCGMLKAGIAIYRWPPPGDTIAVSSNGVDLKYGYFDDYPINDPTKYLIRVYIVKGSDLLAKDFSGKCNPYIILRCGKKRLGDRTSYVPNTIHPVFGRIFEFRCTIPEDYVLNVSLYDFESVQPDELIGSTCIDLEDRVYTKHRACVGLSHKYSLTGATKWRDSSKPSVILEELCLKNHLASPVYSEKGTVIVNGIEYRGNDREGSKSYMSSSETKENICLSLLHQWHTLPLCGYHLVPKHVETRTLYNPHKPGVGQGNIQMWVDIFPLGTNLPIPPPVDISLPKVEEYELRVTIWDIHGLKFGDSTRNTREIFVRGWIGSVNQTQASDLHYYSDKEIGINWRMIFQFYYQHADRMLVFKETGPFTEYEERLPPILLIQVVDNDAASSDDYLGSSALNLNALPRGEKQAQQCTLKVLESSKKVNLFSSRSIRAWWPLVFVDKNSGMNILTGAIDLEMTVLPKYKAALMPVGFGRGPPLPLPEPMRQNTRSSVGNVFSKSFLLKQRSWRIAIISSLGVLSLIAVYFDIPIFIFKRSNVMPKMWLFGARRSPEPPRPCGPAVLSSATVGVPQIRVINNEFTARPRKKGLADGGKPAFGASDGIRLP
ncbi:otoferlin-like [Achroia grisella]|uniref:otoferlin-like n=1 Tax=Achroia grisella TaxID=688607 RepID=UPI0027D30A29|nr:otoferlin-like [Achroia grisella]